MNRGSNSTKKPQDGQPDSWTAAATRCQLTRVLKKTKSTLKKVRKELSASRAPLLPLNGSKTGCDRPTASVKSLTKDDSAEVVNSSATSLQLTAELKKIYLSLKEVKRLLSASCVPPPLNNSKPNGCLAGNASPKICESAEIVGSESDATPPAISTPLNCDDDFTADLQPLTDPFDILVQMFGSLSINDKRKFEESDLEHYAQELYVKRKKTFNR